MPENAATYEDDEVIEFVRSHPSLHELLAALVDDEECSFDHHGGCQAHGYLSLQPGEICPQHEAKTLVLKVRAGA